MNPSVLQYSSQVLMLSVAIYRQRPRHALEISSEIARPMFDTVRAELVELGHQNELAAAARELHAQ